MKNQEGKYYFIKDGGKFVPETSEDKNYFMVPQNITPLLFNFKPVAVISKSNDEWSWKLYFDANGFHYRVSCDHAFSNPIECNKHLDAFCEKNEITLNKKEL